MILRNNNKNIIILNKKIGETPLDALNNLKKKNIFYKDKKLTYAGRLDPLAEGKLLVLAGNECKNKDKYLSLNKEYEFEILLDFKTDTGDILGLVEFNKRIKNYDDLLKYFSNKIKIFQKKWKMKYPVFSSKTIDGKALFVYAQKNKLKDIKIPEKNIEIYYIKYLSKKILKKKELEKKIFDKLNLVKEGGKNNNYFRKEKILKKWKKTFFEIDNREFLILKIKARVSSGTYIRVLAEKIAKDIFNTKGLAFSIKRTKIGIF